MKQIVELYINNQKVYFTQPPDIFFNYSHSDLHNPTVVKNSFSKTITIDGVPENNRIFNEFYDLKRINGENLFNASRKETFVLYRNGEVMETGYVKLDKVNRNGNKISYEVTLYGGLGEFLYNLKFKEDGEQMKLSDLEYSIDFDIDVNKDTVKDAWDHITGFRQVDNSELYDVINFAPSYNGIPEDFSADKVAIDVESFRLADDFDLYNQFITQDGEYSTVNGWLVGELEKEYDEWQMKDLRSYLQRPVIRYKEIFNACCNPDNNGGYEVDLDPDFFNADNPYYENAWMTLPLVTEMEITDIDGEIEVYDEGNGKYTLSQINDGDIFTTELNYFVTSNANVPLQNNGYGHTLVTGVYTFDRDTPLISANMAIYSQLVAYDKDDNPVAGSNVISLTRKYGKIPSDFTYDLEYDAPVSLSTGTFRYLGNENYRYRFFDDFALGSYVGGDMPTHMLKLEKVKYSEGMYLKFVTKIATIDNGTVLGKAGNLFWTEGYDAFATTPYLSERWSDPKIGRVKKKYSVDKMAMLNSEHTPCDYFLSYLKMFNLHIWKDTFDKTIYVRLRKNYFTGDVKDIDGDINWEKDMKITPITFENKWLNFNNEVVETGLAKDYKDSYGVEYGIQKVDTNYNFDTSSKDLFENNVFKTTIQLRNRSRYYNDIRVYTTENIEYPPFMLDGCKTLLFNSSGDTKEGRYITPKTTGESVSWWKEKGYDLMDKPLFADKENKGVEGANVLLFYNGRVPLKDANGDMLTFQVTDDIPEFQELNDGEPCWMWTYKSAYSFSNYFPCFSRYITNENDWITHSWDFGTPRVLYLPLTSIDSSSSIYNKYWQPYIRDQYDANTKIVECYVRLYNPVFINVLEDFYYFDGRIWMLNSVKDYNPSSFNTTKCEFVSINDKSNYLQ